MILDIDIVEGTFHASVAPPYFEDGADMVSLHDKVHADLTARGEITALTLEDYRMFGDVLDQAAAQRAFTWAQRELARLRGA